MVYPSDCDQTFVYGEMSCSCKEWQEKKPQLLSIQQPMSDVSNPRLQLVEVFSVSVCPYDAADAFRLYGTIGCDDRDNYLIFSRDMMKPGIMYPHENLLLLGPCSGYQGTDFVMELHLKDSDGREISNGHLAWRDHEVRGWA